MSTPPGLLEGQSLQASLTVKDLEKSVAWYVEALGFTVSRRIERDGKLRGVAIQAGDVRILLNHDDGAKGWGGVRGGGVFFNHPPPEGLPHPPPVPQNRGPPDKEPPEVPPGGPGVLVSAPDGFRWTISRANAG